MHDRPRQLLFLAAGLTIVFAGGWLVAAADLYVSPRGDDAGPGTEAQPLRTIQKAADTLRPGQTFVGFTSDVSLATAQFILTSGINTTTYPVIDNLAYGTAGVAGGPEETPEVATLLLVGSGLVFICQCQPTNATIGTIANFCQVIYSFYQAGYVHFKLLHLHNVNSTLDGNGQLYLYK